MHERAQPSFSIKELFPVVTSDPLPTVIVTIRLNRETSAIIFEKGWLACCELIGSHWPQKMIGACDPPRSCMHMLFCIARIIQ